MSAPTGAAKPPNVYLPGSHNPKSPLRKPMGIKKPKVRPLAMKSVDSMDEFEEMEDVLKATGPGSRGGKVVRHTKSGKPVYESQAKKQAEQSDKMMQNWHNNAQRSNDPEHHAVAAKQALHAAYFHHHAGDEVASHQSMDYANHHRAQYEKGNHKSRTTTAVEKLHDPTAHEVQHGGWNPEDHGLSHEHMIAEDARRSGDKRSDKIRPGREERKQIGLTKTHKPILAPGKKTVAAAKKGNEHARAAAEEHVKATAHHFTADDHRNAIGFHSNEAAIHAGMAGLSSEKHKATSRAHAHIAQAHDRAADAMDGGSPKQHETGLSWKQEGTHHSAETHHGTYHVESSASASGAMSYEQHRRPAWLWALPADDTHRWCSHERGRRQTFC